MTITTPQQVIALLPMLIIGLTVVVIVLSIARQRNHFVNAILTVIGLNLALLSLLFVGQISPIDVTPMLRIDSFSIFYSGLVMLASLATCIFAYPWLKNFNGNCDEFYLLVLIATLGGVALTSANHTASLFISIELLSLPLFGLIGYTFRQKYSLEAAIKYTILSTVTSSFLLFGIALIYANCGNLSFIALGKNLSSVSIMYHPSLLVGFGMIIISLSFKLSLAPFHLWTADVYQGSPTPVSIFLATASKIAIFSSLIRLFTYIPIVDSETIRNVLVIIAVVSILFGNLLAISQNNIKRLLGYSSISHFGYLIVVIITIQFHKMSLETAGVYLINYLFSSLGAFGIVNLMSILYKDQENIDSLYFYRGLFWKHPLLSMIMTIMMLSLAGIPMTLGFIGKFYVITISIDASLWWLTATAILGSTIGLYYYLRFSINLFLNSSEELHIRQNISSKWIFNTGNLIVLMATILVIVFGIYPQPLLSIVQLAQLSI